MRTYFIILAVFFFGGCSTGKISTLGQSVSKILTFERTGIMDTITVVINGRCVEIEENDTLPKASIKLKNETIAYIAHTDQLGNFKFNHIRAGNYDIEVTCLGYNTKDTTVTVATGEIWKLEVGLSKWNKEMRSKVNF